MYISSKREASVSLNIQISHLTNSFLVFLVLKLYSPYHERYSHKYPSPCCARFQTLRTCSLSVTIKLITLNSFLFCLFLTFKDEKRNSPEICWHFGQKLSEKRACLHLVCNVPSDFHDNTRYDDFKKSKMLSNWPKWLFVTPSVLFGNQAIEIRSFDS